MAISTHGLLDSPCHRRVRSPRESPELPSSTCDEGSARGKSCLVPPQSRRAVVAAEPAQKPSLQRRMSITHLFSLFPQDC